MKNQTDGNDKGCLELNTENQNISIENDLIYKILNNTMKRTMHNSTQNKPSNVTGYEYGTELDITYKEDSPITENGIIENE